MRSGPCLRSPPREGAVGGQVQLNPVLGAQVQDLVEVPVEQRLSHGRRDDLPQRSPHRFGQHPPDQGRCPSGGGARPSFPPVALGGAVGASGPRNMMQCRLQSSGLVSKVMRPRTRFLTRNRIHFGRPAGQGGFPLGPFLSSSPKQSGVDSLHRQRMVPPYPARSRPRIEGTPGSPNRCAREGSSASRCICLANDAGSRCLNSSPFSSWWTYSAIPP